MEEVGVKKDLFTAFFVAVLVHGIIAVADVSTVRPLIHLKKDTRQLLDVSFVTTVSSEKKKIPVKPVITPPPKPVVVKKTKPMKKKPVIEKKQVEKKAVVREDAVPDVPEVVTASPVEHHEIISDPVMQSVILAVPRYEENSPPPYPRIARRRGYEGVVILSVEVRNNGTVGGITLKESSGHSILDAAALKTVKKWKFQPGVRSDVPITMVVDVPIRFMLN